MPSFVIRGHRLHYELHGPAEAPALVLLHHGLGASAGWQAQIEFFSDRYRVLAYDRLGYGRSDHRPAFTAGYLREDTEEAVALLEHLSIRRARILGHSDGGTIALLLASQQPELVCALALEAAHIYYEPKIRTGISNFIQAFQQDDTLRTRLSALHGAKTHTLLESWLPHWHHPENVPSPLVTPQEIKRIKCPVLVIQGTEDEYATPQHAIDIDAALSDSRLWLVDGGGHMLHNTVTETYNQRIADFFTAVCD